MNQSKLVSVAMVVCFVSGVLVGVYFKQGELDFVNLSLETEEIKTTLLEYEVELLRAQVKVLKDLVEYYKGLLDQPKGYTPLDYQLI